MNGHSSESKAFAASNRATAAGKFGFSWWNIAKMVRKLCVVDLIGMNPDWSDKISFCIKGCILSAIIFANILASLFINDSGRYESHLVGSFSNLRSVISSASRNEGGSTPSSYASEYIAVKWGIIKSPYSLLNSPGSPSIPEALLFGRELISSFSSSSVMGWLKCSRCSSESQGRAISSKYLSVSIADVVNFVECNHVQYYEKHLIMDGVS